MNWETIRNEYETTYITLKALSEKHDIKLGTLKSRKSREGWNRDATQTKKVATNKSPPVAKPKKETKPIVESEQLTEKQRLFCMHYLKSFNATQSAIKAGYSKDSAHVQGPRLLGNVRVGDYIRQLKEEMQAQLFVSAADVLNAYMKIAFADITEYITFDSYVRYERNEDGSMREDDEGNPISYQVSKANFVSSDEVDGTLITEVKQGKDGVSIKLADKMKALEKLEQYFDLLPDQHKRQVEDEKLKIAHARLEIEKEKVSKDDTNEPIEIMIRRKGDRND